MDLGTNMKRAVIVGFIVHGCSATDSFPLCSFRTTYFFKKTAFVFGPAKSTATLVLTW
jgi:hypothetical protein